MDTNPDRSALACWQRFTAAASAVKRGDYGPARALIARVRASSGDYAARCARRELRAFCGLDEHALDDANRRVAPVVEIGDADE